MLEIGRITRPHGVRGELRVRLVSNRTERLDPGSVLTSELGPLSVVSAREHKGDWLVRFAGIDDRNRAEELRGLVLSAAPITDPEELWVHDLVGAQVVDQHGLHRGTVTGVTANPASDLLELDSGALVPVRFVVSHRPGAEVVVDAPDGLFDLAAGAAGPDEDGDGRDGLRDGPAGSRSEPGDSGIDPEGAGGL